MQTGGGGGGEIEFCPVSLPCEYCQCTGCCWASGSCCTVQALRRDRHAQAQRDVNKHTGYMQTNVLNKSSPSCCQLFAYSCWQTHTHTHTHIKTQIHKGIGKQNVLGRAAMLTATFICHQHLLLHNQGSRISTYVYIFGFFWPGFAAVPYWSKVALPIAHRLMQQTWNTRVCV